MSVPELPGTSSAEQFLSGKLTQVDVVGIERELRQLWQTASEAELDAGHPAVSRACALNLVLYTGDDNAETEAGDLLDEIAITHPCRALLAIARPDDTPDLEAWVSARCHLPAPGATRQICCEQITVRWEGDGLNELPSVVLPLLVPDLPVFLYWRTDRFTVSHLDPFLTSVDRLIIDSGRWEGSLEPFKELSGCSDRHGKRMAVSDLSWRRLYPWREAMASAFDVYVMDLTAADLERLQAVEIEYDRGALCQAVLVASWIASRLGLSPVSSDVGSGLLRFAAGSTGFSARLLERQAQAQESPGLRAVRLSMGARGLDVTLGRPEGKPALVIEARSGPSVTKTVLTKAPETVESRLIGHELDVLGCDGVFEATLQVVAQILSPQERVR